MSMERKSCVFFGHRDGDYQAYREKIARIFTQLIEKEGVTQFYTGARGNFDRICADILHGLRARYPQIKITLVYSYIPQEENPNVGRIYDDSVYLLEERVLPRFAIWETNKRIIQKSAFVLTAVWKDSGGAFRAKNYAVRQGKKVVDIYD